MHASELRMLYKERNYEEIYSRIQQEMEKLVLRNKLSTDDLEGLQSSIEEEIRRGVHEQRGIPRPLINIILLQGESFEAKIRSLLISYLASLCSVDYQEFLCCNFQKLSSLKSCFTWIEESMARISLKYSNVPDDWNLPQEILLKYYVLTKQRACDYFFYNEIDEQDFVEAFDVTIKHERRLGRAFEKHGCCVCSLQQPAGNESRLVPSSTETSCPHRTMISSLFVPNIEIYLRASFRLLVESELNLQDVKVCVFSRFLDFFRGLERIFKKIGYLNDRPTYRHLVHCFDDHLGFLMRKICPSKDMYGSIIVLNTILFVRETGLDFLDQVMERSGVEEDAPKMHAEARRIEGLQNALIDDYLSHYFSELDFTAPEGLSKEIIRFLDKEIMSESNSGMYEDVRIMVLESIISHVFSRIYSIKITPKASEAILLETAEVKRYLRTKTSVIPLIDVVEKYLKIFLCPPDNTRCFAENFVLMSEGIFSFDQIISNIEDGHGADELYLAYEEITGSSKAIS
ncbi:hypothetical protein M970_101120 [Encephalitozoon cuniculi EcunIII-L]|uniref:Uncharacterized protein n=1 Tax=Encephalitozoon cuniculi TaxID=6035 RepID=M1JKU0_ENCCN|nr:hypothetical protein ECU10_1190 [Encephalitozoon cuniculi]KMV65271.1 hypothetical protein M970_101120 [Encephalitozoon cuniculi EcunIII-L]UYI26581.1 hypothetical protein J0A71_02g04120 [Encephalitozoon cuniculi]